MIRQIKISLIGKVLVIGLVTVLIVLSAFLFFQAGRNKEEPSEKPVNQDLHENEGPLENLSEDFPGSFPMYQNATSSGSWIKEKDAQKGASVVLESTDSARAVYDFYMSELIGKDWSVNSKESGNLYTITFENNSYKGFLGITESSLNKTIISVTITSRLK